MHLGYTLPKAWTGKLRIQKVKVYVEGNNLCTWSGLPEGIDPEWPGVTNGYYPAAAHGRGRPRNLVLTDKIQDP